MENSQVAQVFDEIADLLELKEGNEFRIRSYRNAARTVRDLSDRLEDLVAQDADLRELPNIGDSTAEKIYEILEEGTCRRLENLRQEMPEGMTELLGVPDLGPKTAMQLHRQLGVADLDDLREACENHEVRNLEGLGAKTEEKLLEGVKRLASSAGRRLRKDAQDYYESLRRYLDGLDSIDQWEVAGSYRRRKETVGDLDVLVRASDRQAAAEEIAAYEPIERVVSKGTEKTTVRVSGDLQVDFRFFDDSQFGSAMLYFTGSKAHNIALRRRAQQHDWKLNEYGLFHEDRRLAGKSEAAVYHRLDLPWIPPELREDRGEIDAADAGNLPDLIENEDVRGDLQSHTTASDGTSSIREMAQAAKDRGREYLAITDHSKNVSVAGGLDDEAAREHTARIRQVDGGYEDFWLLAGIEVDILKSGKLDLKDETLAEMDWVIASIHYNRNLSESKMTERYLSAIKSGVVHAIAHPLGRIIGRRKPLAFDFDKVVQACAEHDVCLEINAQPDRLDLPDTYCQQARRSGVCFSMGTDAHKPAGLDFLGFAVDVARRGWLGKGDVLNTRTPRQLATFLDKKG